MKTFVIRFAAQTYFGHGFWSHTIRAKGAKQALDVLKSVRSEPNPAILVWVTIE